MFDGSARADPHPALRATFSRWEKDERVFASSRPWSVPCAIHGLPSLAWTRPFGILPHLVISAADAIHGIALAR
jgi:hypothetical protein